MRSLMLSSRVFGLAGFALLATVGWSQTTAYPVFETDKLPASLYAKRRAEIKQKLGNDGITFLFTNPERNRNNDCDFRFRGDSNFLYLSGFEEPDAAIILAPGGVNIDGKTVTEILFVNESDKMSETWLGYRMGPVDGKTLTGFEAVLPNRRFSEVLSALPAKPNLYRTILPQGATGSLSTMVNAYSTWAKAAAENSGKTGLNQWLTRMRGVKSPEEIELIRKAVNASVAGHNATIKMCKPGLREYHLQATMEYHFAMNGCESVGYNSIVGSGANSTILHYEDDRKLIQNGDIICMDCAGEYHGYSADVTRTFPANGKFSPEQKAIYQIVYDAQEAGIAACRAGRGFGEADAAARKVVADGLLKLGLIKNAGESSRYFMHGTSHGIGLDVHDPAPGTLVPGVLMTVEPGIYIKAGSPCDRKWWNIGVRIEDDILVTDGNPINLSAGVPRRWDEIERLMKK